MRYVERESIKHNFTYLYILEQGRQVVKDFYYDPSNLTLPVPSGDYLLLLTWLFDNRKQFVTNVYFSFHQDVFIE